MSASGRSRLERVPTGLRAALGTAWLPVAAATAVGAVLRWHGLGDQSFWVDETITARLVAASFPELLDTLPRAESTPPLYYVLAWLWARVAGVDEAGVRSLSALAGTATIPVCYAAARTLVSHRAGVIAAALAAVSPLLVWYSQEARAYALFLLTAALSFLFFARALESPAERRLALWAGASGLALATHYFAVFPVAAEAMILLLRHRGRSAALAVGAVGAVGVALLPLAAYQTIHASSRWIRFVDLGQRVEEATLQLVLPSAPSIWAGAGVPEGHGNAWWPLALALLGGAAAVVVGLGSRAERRGALIALGVGLATVGVPLLGSLAAAVVSGGRGDVFLYRNVVAAWLPLTVVVAAALGVRRAPRAGLLVAAALLAWSLVVAVENDRTPTLQRDDWRLVVGALGPPSGQVVVLSPSWQQAGLEYYDRGLRELGAGTTTDEIALLVRRHVPEYSPAVRTLAPPPGFVRAETRELQSWLLTTFRAERPVYVRTGDVEIDPAGSSWVPLVRRR